MTFEDILALCLDALEHGETIEHCLTRYPQHATELAALLSLATAVRSAPQPRLSAGAFARGYAAVVAQVHYQNLYHAPFQPVRSAVPQKSAKPVMRAQSVAARKLIAAPPRLAQPFLFLYKAQPALLACLVALSLFALFRNINISLPGTWLYPVKILGENVGGVLLTAADEQATWHAHQTENRLQELVYLAQQGKTANVELEQTIDQAVMATLAASNHLPPAQRNEFLQAWLTRLQAIDKANQSPSTATLTLNRTLATIQATTKVTVVQPTLEPTDIPIGAPTPKLANSHTLIPAATANPPTDTSLVAEPTTPPAATVLPLAPVVIHPATIAPALAPSEPLVLATATMASVVVQVPQETPAQDDNRHQTPAKAAISQPASTTAALVAAAASTQTLGIGNVGSGEVQPSTNPSTSVETAPDKASVTDNGDKADTPTNTPTPAFGVVGNPTPATDTSPAIAPTEALITEEAIAATPAQTVNPESGTPSTEKTSLPTRLATAATTPTVLPSGTASNPTTPVTVKPEKTIEPTATDEPTDLPTPTISAKPTKTPESADTPDRSAATVEAPPTATPASTPTPKKHK